MSSLLLFHQNTHWSKEVGLFFPGVGGPSPGVVIGGIGGGGWLGVVTGGGGTDGSLGVTGGGWLDGGGGGGGVGSPGSRRPGGTAPPGPRNCPPWASAPGAKATRPMRLAARPPRPNTSRFIASTP